MHLFFFITVLGILLTNLTQASTLPKSISATEFDRVVETLGYGSTARLMRSAEPYTSFPGFKLGMELVLIPSKGINDMGDASGTLPSIIFAPRIYMAKGLFNNMEIIFSFFSPKILDTLTSVGAMLKYTFYSERETWVSAALYLGYTGISGFTSSYKGSDVEFGAYFSKDYVRLKPYIGTGLLFSRGEIDPLYVQSKSSGWQSTVHFFLGLEFELPINFTAQLDLMNLSPGGTLLFAKRF